jgi:hypothetical protein
MINAFETAMEIYHGIERIACELDPGALISSRQMGGN